VFDCGRRSSVLRTDYMKNRTDERAVCAALLARLVLHRISNPSHPSRQAVHPDANPQADPTADGQHAVLACCRHGGQVDLFGWESTRYKQLKKKRHPQALVELRVQMDVLPFKCLGRV